jgi:hypothetical protein
LEQQVTKRGFNPVLLQQTSLVEEKAEPKFLHPFTDEQVEEIKTKYKELARNNFQGITLEDQKKVIIPHLVIHRTEVFCLKDTKKRQEDIEKRTKQVNKQTKEKTKKLTKKQYSDKLMSIIMAKAQGLAITEEEHLFYNTHRASEDLI